MLGILRLFFFFFFNDTATTEIYTLSLHDALPIFPTKIPTAAAQKSSSTSWPRFSRRACKPRKRRRQNLPAPPRSPLPDHPLRFSCKEKCGHCECALQGGARKWP